jgi:hypothetical protein
MSPFTIENIFPLTAMQQGMLFHGQLSEDAFLYAEQSSCFINGPLNLDAFKTAWQFVVERHSALRTLYVLDDEEALQLVTKGQPLNWQELDWQLRAESLWRQDLEQLRSDDLCQGFDMAKETPLRLTIVKLTAERHYFIWRYHHVMHDGWSIPLVFSDVQAAYFSISQGRRPFLPPVAKYTDYIQWLSAQDTDKAQQFWQTYLAGFTQANTLGCESSASDLHHSRSMLLDVDAAKVERVARQLGVTQNSLFQLAWSILIYRLSGQSDVVFGATTSGRPATLANVEKMVGLFINSLPVRVNLHQGGSVAQALNQLMKEQLQARSFEFYPLMAIQKSSELAPGSQLFDSLLVFENYLDESTLNQPGSTIALAHFETFGRNNFPLSLLVIPGPQIGVKLSYQEGRFSGSLIDALPEYLAQILAMLLDNPAMPLSQVRICSDKDLALYGNTVTPSRGTLVSMFAKQADLNPIKTAIYDSAGSIDYQSLQTMADDIAARLITKGIAPGDRVALHMAKGRALVASMLAVMKMGGCYIGLPLTTSQQRLEKVCQHARVTMLLSEEENSSLPQHLGFAALMALPPAEKVPQDQSSGEGLAYIAYTSGSTGEPKGIMASHQSVANYLNFIAMEYHIGSDD